MQPLQVFMCPQGIKYTRNGFVNFSMQAIHSFFLAGSEPLWLKADNSIMGLTAKRSEDISARSFVSNLFATFHNFIQAFESDIFCFLETPCVK